MTIGKSSGTRELAMTVAPVRALLEKFHKSTEQFPGEFKSSAGKGSVRR